MTNLHTDLDYDRLAAELPEAIVPAYDGLVIETSAAELMTDLNNAD